MFLTGCLKWQSEGLKRLLLRESIWSVLKVDGKWINHPIPDTAVQIGLITGVFFHSTLLAEEAQGNHV